ncbi:sensor histidine kinase [Burkholderia ubonensis]|uniref:sensor histidine kinase n=1 Tax=Burkholderia ubonensis TaxID=101571 RepID=UPI0009B3886C|nr:sensor histidine kinase [Burkholderia ubonensis]
MSQKELKFRPYARLLTMLGDQLIKNERIALVEVIKNSYDADASWVKVTFEGFTADFGATANSKIIIEDDGVGMTREVIEDHWVNPATPVKMLAKEVQRTTKKGRVIQGEKGIGRFALLKLGKKIKITTRPKRSRSEFELNLDVSSYDENFLSKGKKALFLEDLSLTLEETEPASVIRSCTMDLGARELKRATNGTRIEISHLSSPWSHNKVEKVFDDLARLQSIFSDIEEFDNCDDASIKIDNDDPHMFEVAIYRDEEFQPFTSQLRERLLTLIEEQAVFKVENGIYDEQTRTFSFLLNGENIELPLSDSDITSLTLYRRWRKIDPGIFDTRGTTCGSFGFQFYVFDFSAEAEGKYDLVGPDKELIKKHRVYLYRDGVRVYPYGDPDDDWLGIDVYRGTVRASEFVSNDQVVGFVSISQDGNPELRDKTNREGLIDTGHATEDFRALLQLILAWIRKKPYEQYRRALKTKHEVEIFKKEQVQRAFDGVTEAAADSPPKLKEKIAEANKLYNAERKYLIQRAETTEHLAGVGLSVETASHDLMVAMTRALSVVDSLISESHRPGTLDKEIVSRELNMVRGILSFVQTQMKDLQQLFKSTKQRRKDVRVAEVLRKVQRLFQSALDKAHIEIEIIESQTPLVAKTTDAVLLQLFLNLFDNAVYWLESKQGTRKILITLEGDEGYLIFSDNGPGIKADDAPYIFDPFYSGKGQEGRGLGLYIARQLLERHEYSIDLADLKSQKPLGGANFVVSFVKEDL